MTLLNCLIEPHQVVVFSDTLVCDASDPPRPRSFAAKVHVLPHLGMMVAGRGAHDVIARFAATLEALPCYGADDLDEMAGPILKLLGQVIPESRATRLFVFGWSAAAGRFVGRRFASETGFALEVLDGYYVAPGLDEGGTFHDAAGSLRLNGVDDLARYAMRQHDEDRARADWRAGIGGMLMMNVASHAEDGLRFYARRVLDFPTMPADRAQIEADARERGRPAAGLA